MADKINSTAMLCGRRYDDTVRPQAESGAGRAAAGGEPAQRLDTGGDALPLPLLPQPKPVHVIRVADLIKRAHSRPPTAAERAAADEKRKERRHGRWSLRWRIQQITELKALRDCGSGVIPGKEAELRMRNTPEGIRANFANALCCASVWSCPQCAAKIANDRAGEVRQVLKTALDQGYSAAFATFTMRHRKQHSLRDLWNAISLAWSRVTGGRAWPKQCAAMGIVGFVRVWEVTFSWKNGWHVHVHVLLVFDRKVKISYAREATHQMWERWARSLKKSGFTCDRDKGHDVRMANLHNSEGNRFEQYFTKMAHEITSGYAKAGKSGHLSPFQIADLATADELPPEQRRQYLAVWHEWEQASRGRKQMAMSDAVREWAKVPEVADEQLMLDENGQTAADTAIALPSETWLYLVKRPWEACNLLDAAEDGGAPAAVQWLEDRGLHWHWPPPPDEADIAREALRERDAMLRQVREIFGAGAVLV